MAKVFLAGMAVVDFVFAVETLPQSDGKFRAEEASVVGGGCAANAAVAVVRLGGEASLVTRLGADSLADMIIGDLEREGVATDLVQYSRGGQSSFSSIYVDKGGERQIMNFRGAGLDDRPDWGAIKPDTDAVLVDTRWPEGALAALQQARSLGIPGVLDAEAPIDPKLLETASHVAFSRNGLLSISKTGDLPEALAAFSAANECWACVTDGAAGVYYTGGGQIRHVPGFQVDVKDTLAAGDIWHGAFALRLGEGAQETQAVRFANTAAALKCMHFGGRAGCPDRQVTDEFLKEKNECN